MKMEWNRLDELIEEAEELKNDIRGTARLRQMEIAALFKEVVLDENAPDASYHSAMDADMIVAVHGEAGQYYSREMEDHADEMASVCAACGGAPDCPCERQAEARAGYPQKNM